MKKKRQSHKSELSTSIKTILPWVGVLSALFIMAGVVYVLARTFSVQNVLCSIESQPACSADLEQFLQSSLKNQSMFFVNYPQLLSQNGEFPEPVSVVSIKKFLPNTVEIAFQLETPLYQIQTSDKQVVVSTSGKLFHDLTLPNQHIVVHSQQTLTEENNVLQDVHSTLSSIIATINELKLPITQITWVDKSTIRLSMNERGEEAVIDSERPVLALHKLSTILKAEEYRSVEGTIAEIDLRFAMPVLRMKP